MYTFPLTYDRHKGKYGFRTTNFPNVYYPDLSSLNYTQDPDWTVKMKPRRINFKRILLFMIIGYYLF